MPLMQIDEPAHQSPCDLVVVDDDEMMLEIIARNLRRCPANFLLFADPENAMNYLCKAQFSPRILVIDFYMPPITGIEFISGLRDHVNLDGSCVYVCSSVTPRQNQLDLFPALGASNLEKEVLLDMNRLHKLVENSLPEVDR